MCFCTIVLGSVLGFATYPSAASGPSAFLYDRRRPPSGWAADKSLGEEGWASSFRHSTLIKILTSARLRSSLESALSAHKTTGPHQRGFAPKGPAREGTASADEDTGCARLPPHDDPGCCPDSVQKPDFPKILPFAAPREKFLLKSDVWPSFWPQG